MSENNAAFNYYVVFGAEGHTNNITASRHSYKESTNTLKLFVGAHPDPIAVCQQVLHWSRTVAGEHTEKHLADLDQKLK